MSRRAMPLGHDIAPHQGGPGTAVALTPRMDLRQQRASHNVEDRRGMGIAAGGIGVGGIVIALIAYFLGFETAVMQQVGEPQTERPAAHGAPADETGQFVAKVLGSTEEVDARLRGFRRAV